MPLTDTPSASDRLRALGRSCEEIAAQLDAAHQAGVASEAHNADDTVRRAAMAERMLRLRRDREAQFGADLFADPVWDMLLDLFAQLRHGRPISVSSLCIAAAVPATTALRYITLMEAEGLVTRSRAPDDHRRRYVTLTETAATKLRGLLERAERLGL